MLRTYRQKRVLSVIFSPGQVFFAQKGKPGCIPSPGLCQFEFSRQLGVDAGDSQTEYTRTRTHRHASGSEEGKENWKTFNFSFVFKPRDIKTVPFSRWKKKDCKMRSVFLLLFFLFSFFFAAVGRESCSERPPNAHVERTNENTSNVFFTFESVSTHLT